MGVMTDEGREQRARLVQYLRDHQRSKGYLPSVREMCEELGATRPTIMWHLDKLRDQGFVSYTNGHIARSLRVAKGRHVSRLE